MFDIGFAELILLAGLGLIVLGPQRLPRVAAQLGRWVGQARRMSRTLMYQLRQEVNLDDPGPFASRGPSMSEGAREGARTSAQTGARASAREGAQTGARASAREGAQTGARTGARTSDREGAQTGARASDREAKSKESDAPGEA